MTQQQSAADAPLRVGDVIYGFCGGIFGRDSYSNKRVEFIGADWVVCRETAFGDVGVPVLYHGCPDDLKQYRTPEPDL
jgi:hypothetical protein